MTTNSKLHSVTDLLDLMKTGKISAKEYAVDLSEKVKQLEYLNSIKSFNEDSLIESAKVADQKRASGKGGALCGVPFVAKDNINSKLFPTTACTTALMDNVTASDSPVIDLLTSEDAILGAKANMHELAFGITSNNVVTGPVKNPHNQEKIAGGSSGGTAAAVAAGIFPIGLGTDTGGSCRIPAALCGVVGFRPSTNRYSAEGVVPISHTRDTVGTIAKSVSDVCLFDSVMSNSQFKEKKMPLNTITLGIPKEVFFDNLEPVVEKVVQSQLKTLESAGVKLREISMSDIWSHNEAFGFPVALYEVMRDLPKYLARYVSGLKFEELVEGIGSPDVAGVFSSQMGEDAMPKEAYDAAMNIHRPKMLEIYETTFKANNLNAIIFPTTPLTARNIGEDETVDLNGVQVPTFPTYIRNTDLGSNIGAPGISLPCNVESDLPIGIEFEGMPGGDNELLSLSKSIEMTLTS